MAKPSWISLSKSSGSGGASVSVTASENTTINDRNGSISVKTSSGLSKSISINQDNKPNAGVPYTMHIMVSPPFGANMPFRCNCSKVTDKNGTTVTSGYDTNVKWGVKVEFEQNPNLGTGRTYEVSGSALIGAGNSLTLEPTGLGDVGVANSETFYVTYNGTFPPSDLKDNYKVVKASLVIG